MSGKPDSGEVPPIVSIDLLVSNETATSNDKDLSADADDTPTGTSRGEEERREMFGKVADICGLDMKLKASRIGKTVKNLRKAGYGMEELERFGKEIWLYDWRWSKHRQRPTLAILEEEIGKLRAKPLDIPRVVEEKPLVGFVHDNNRTAERFMEKLEYAEAELRESIAREEGRIEVGESRKDTDAIVGQVVQRLSQHARN
jgi:hypothetical protein